MPDFSGDTFSEILSLPPDELPEVIDLVLWGFEDPASWLSADDVRGLIICLSARPDALSSLVQEAIANCNDYLNEGLGRRSTTDLQTR